MIGPAMCLETKKAVTVTTPNPGGAGQTLRVRLNVMRHLTRLEVLAVDIQYSLLCSGGIHTLGLPKSMHPDGPALAQEPLDILHGHPVGPGSVHTRPSSSHKRASCTRFRETCLVTEP